MMSVCPDCGLIVAPFSSISMALPLTFKMYEGGFCLLCWLHLDGCGIVQQIRHKICHIAGVVLPVVCAFHFQVMLHGFIGAVGSFLVTPAFLPVYSLRWFPVFEVFHGYPLSFGFGDDSSRSLENSSAWVTSSVIPFNDPLQRLQQLRRRRDEVGVIV